jgi:uncharacterized protein (DUF1501 family)
MNQSLRLVCGPLCAAGHIKMNRREFLKILLLTPFITTFAPQMLFALARQPNWRNLLVLIELKGGNDGLNTVIPYTESLYYQFRPELAIARDQILTLDEHLGFNPQMKDLMPFWQNNELAIIEGVGYPEPNLSHFRSIEIWETASSSEEFLTQGWLSRVFTKYRPPEEFAADGIIVGGQSLGPLTGGDTRALILSGGRHYQKPVQGKKLSSGSHNPAALKHIYKVEPPVNCV